MADIQNRPDTTGLRATMTALSPAGWEIRRAGACAYRVTTPRALTQAERARVEQMFHPDTEFQYVEGATDDAD